MKYVSQCRFTAKIRQATSPPGPLQPNERQITFSAVGQQQLGPVTVSSVWEKYQVLTVVYPMHWSPLSLCSPDCRVPSSRQSPSESYSAAGLALSQLNTPGPSTEGNPWRDIKAPNQRRCHSSIGRSAEALALEAWSRTVSDEESASSTHGRFDVSA